MVNEENHIRIHNLEPQWKVFPKQSQRLRAPDYFPVSSGRSEGPPGGGSRRRFAGASLCLEICCQTESPIWAVSQEPVFGVLIPWSAAIDSPPPVSRPFPSHQLNALSTGVAMLKVGSGALGSCWNSPENFAQGERMAGAGPARNRRRVRGGDSHHSACRGQGGASGMHRPSFSMKRKLSLLSRGGGKEWCPSGRAQAR